VTRYGSIRRGVPTYRCDRQSAERPLPGRGGGVADRHHDCRREDRADPGVAPGEKIDKRGANDDAKQYEAVTRLHRTLGYQTPAEYEEHNKIRNVA
jgi:hypothetical protein